MKRKGKYYLLAAFATLAVTICVGGYSAWQYFWGGAVARDAVVLVPTGSDFDRADRFASAKRRVAQCAQIRADSAYTRFGRGRASGTL